MRTIKSSSKNKSTVSERDAKKAVMILRDKIGDKKREKSASWSEGGKQYEKVLGHFGSAAYRR